MHYYFDVMIPANRVGHHVLWIAWQRDDPVGEVFFSTSDIMVAAADGLAGDYNNDRKVDASDYTVVAESRGRGGGNAAERRRWRRDRQRPVSRGGRANFGADEAQLGRWRPFRSRGWRFYLSSHGRWSARRGGCGAACV